MWLVHPKTKGYAQYLWCGWSTLRASQRSPLGEWKGNCSSAFDWPQHNSKKIPNLVLSSPSSRSYKATPSPSAPPCTPASASFHNKEPGFHCDSSPSPGRVPMAKESGFDSIWFLLRILLLGSAPWVLGFLKRDYEDEYFSPYTGMKLIGKRTSKTPIY